jgi:hypothetical protein
MSYPPSRRWVCRFITSRYRCPTPRRSQSVPWWRPSPPSDRRYRTATRTTASTSGSPRTSDRGSVIIDIVSRDFHSSEIRTGMPATWLDARAGPRLEEVRLQIVRFLPDARIHGSVRRFGHAVLRHQRQRCRGTPTLFTIPRDTGGDHLLGLSGGGPGQRGCNNSALTVVMYPGWAAIATTCLLVPPLS